MFSNDKIFVGPASDCSSHHWEPVPELARKSRAVITDCLVTDAKREGGAETKRALITSSAAKTGGRTERQPQEERVTRRKDGSIPSGSGVSFFFPLFVFFPSLLLSHPPRCTDRDSAAEEKNVDDEIKRKVCRFAGGVIRKASGGRGGRGSTLASTVRTSGAS